ncbi:MAG TPA: SLC13 family permease [Anaerolineales bacterium]
MTPQIAWVLIIILAAGVLFTFEWVPADVTALGILVLLVVLGLLPDEEACSGFGSETVLMIFGLFVLTAALLRTGVVDIARRKVLQYSSDNPIWLLSGFFGLAVLLTQPMSNQAAAIVVVPVAIQTALPCPDFLALSYGG